MSRRDVMFGGSRILAASAGIVIVIAGWYVAMTVGLGGAYGTRLNGTNAALGVTWLVAGTGALIAASLGRRYTATASALEMLAGIVVAVTAASAAGAVWLAPGVLMIAAAHGAVLSRLSPRSKKTLRQAGPQRVESERGRDRERTKMGRAA